MKKALLLIFILTFTSLHSYSSQSLTLTSQKENVNYLFDTKGRLERIISLPQIDYEFVYDDSNNLIQVFDHIRQLETIREYDSNGLILFEKLNNGLTMTYERNSEGQCVKKILCDGSEIEYNYDQKHLTSIKRKDAIFSYTEFDTLHRPLKAELINGLGTNHWKWYNDGKLLEYKCPFLNETLSYNEKGLITSCLTNDNLQHFSYDTENKLITDEKIDQFDTQFDTAGNLIQKNQLILNYDPLGRLISCELEHVYRAEYTYDAFNRRLTKKHLSWNQKKKKWIEKANLSFLWDDELEIGAVNRQGKIVELRCLGLGYSAEIGASCIVEMDEKLYQPIHNYRGDLVQLIDPETEQIVCFQEFTPYGNATISGALHSPWQFLNKRYDPETGFIYFGNRYYDPTLCHWITQNPNLFSEDLNKHTFLHDDPVNQLDLKSFLSFDRIAYGALSSLIKTYNFASNSMTTIRDQFDYPTYLKPSFEAIGKALFGRDYLLLAGFYSDKAQTGVFGKGEVNDLVRITYINGMLNSREDYKDSLEYFSSTHGGVNIHYIYNPTDGWTWDLLKCFQAKLGQITPQAEQLAETWKKLIQEMGGPEKGGTIIHYCHSIGGTHTANAKTLMTEEERQMIHVISFGSATMIEEKAFGQVINYVSKRDGVCMLHPIPWIQTLWGREPQTELIGDWLGCPFIDHPLSCETYEQMVNKLGDEFIKCYL